MKVDHDEMTPDEPYPVPEAMRALDDVVAPDSLRLAIAEQVAGAGRTQERHRRRLRLRLGGALAGAA
ncbi:MAG TPA: hypothetical protein VFV85_01995, partial [Conexibacter sp.]|nr:hypothetical protein [Conexibacter sp.]